MKIIKKHIDNSEKKNHSRPHICWGSLFCTNLTLPTGALDSKAATNLLKQLREINRTGQTILMVTHSNVAASYADRVMFIKDGEVFHQIYRGDMTRSALLDKICDAVTVLMRGGEDSES